MNTTLFSFPQHFRTGALAFIFLLLLQSCANIVPPSGGPKDVTKPELISISPPDSGLNKKPSKIELRFNKYMLVEELQKNMEISPLLPVNPTVLSYGKRVEIKLIDSLLHDSTTYRISLGNALVGNRERNPFENFVYIFSTGAYFDSLQFRGRVYDAATGLPDSSATIFLYPATAADSAILRQKPTYVKKVDVSGDFSFALLPDKPFRVYAVQDENHNLIYDIWEEKVDFSDTLIRPTAHNDSFYVFNIFKEVPPADSVSNISDTISSREALTADEKFERNRRKQKNEVLYQVAVDTTRPDQRTVELTDPLVIKLNTPLATLDSSKVYLSYEEEGIDVQAIQTLRVDPRQIKIKTQWLEDKIYILRLVKGWATDTSGTELPPGKYRFRTKRSADYGNLTIHIAPPYQDSGYVLYIYQDEDSIYQKPITTPDINIPLLPPGNYQMRIIVDENRNGQWDPGVLFQKKHAESVIPYPQHIVLKAGWENEVDFNEQKNEPIPSSAAQNDTFLERSGRQNPPPEK